MLYIQEFIKTYPNWETLLSDEPYCLKISYDDNYAMFKYNQLKSDFSLPIVQEARGIIFDMDSWDCVCYPFKKFFNFGEPNAHEIDWAGGVRVSEKIDGSLMKVWCHNGEWHLSTNGSIDAFKSETGNILYPNFGVLFEYTLSQYGYDSFEEFCKFLAPGHTHMFELATPFNRVVVPYEDCCIYYLGQRVGQNPGFRIPFEEEYKVNKLKVHYPKVYNLKTIDDVVAAANELGWAEEGYVVCDQHFNRVKVKSPAYVKAHFARNNNVITRKHLIRIILDNEIDEFLTYAAEYEEQLEIARGKMAFYKSCLRSWRKLADTKLGLPRSEYAAFLKEEVPDYAHNYLFKYYDRGLSVEEYVEDWDENKWDKFLG